MNQPSGRLLETQLPSCYDYKRAEALGFCDMPRRTVAM
jgi:hypothetical protein